MSAILNAAAKRAIKLSRKETTMITTESNGSDLPVWWAQCRQYVVMDHIRGSESSNSELLQQTTDVWHHDVITEQRPVNSLNIRLQQR